MDFEDRVPEGGGVVLGLMVDAPGAAHSMDTMWFAVDEDDCVAVFETGEDGSVPGAALNEDGYGLLQELVQAAGADGQLEEGMLEDLYLDELAAVEGGVGVFIYHYPGVGSVLEPYERASVPARPVRLSRLDPELRRRLKVVRPRGVRFAEASTYQPAAEFDVESWGGCAWVDGDMIRALPGHEAEYARFYSLNFVDGVGPGGQRAEVPTVGFDPGQRAGRQGSRQDRRGVWVWVVLAILGAAVLLWIKFAAAISG